VSKKDITLLSGTDAIPRGCHQAGLLFECAPDGAAYRGAGTVVSLAELVGDFPEAKCKAFALARKLLQDEPPLRGVRQLGIFEEVVIRELQRAFHSIHLHRALQSRGISTGCARFSVCRPHPIDWRRRAGRRSRESQRPGVRAC